MVDKQPAYWKVEERWDIKKAICVDTITCKARKLPTFIASAQLNISVSQTFGKVWCKPLLPVQSTATLTFPAEQCRAVATSLTPVEQSTRETIHGVKSALHLVNVYSNLFIVASFQTNQPTAADPSRLWHVSTLESDTRHSLGRFHQKHMSVSKVPKIHTFTVQKPRPMIA